MDLIDSMLERGREDYKGMFKRRYTLKGRDWLKRVDAEARAIFNQIGNIYNQGGHAGGVARAKTARRNAKGQFVKEA